MKLIYFTLIASLVFVGCQPPVDNAAIDAFETNSKTIVALLEGFQNENLDYDAYYAQDLVVRPTGFGTPDSLSLEDHKARSAKFYERFDAELMTELILLPGVSVDTKKADGSVRYYGTWKITLSATDTTEAKSGEFKTYESFDFDEEGKIVYQQLFGDFGGLFEHLFDDDNEDEDNAADTAE